MYFVNELITNVHFDLNGHNEIKQQPALTFGPYKIANYAFFLHYDVREL